MGKKDSYFENRFALFIAVAIWERKFFLYVACLVAIFLISRVGVEKH